MVVINGAKRVHRTFAAIEIFKSSYSVSPNSSSLVCFFYAVSTFYDTYFVKLTFNRSPTKRWNTRSNVSPIQRSNRSLLQCFEDNTRKSFSVSLSRASPTFHTSEPGPRREQSLPVARPSQLRSKLKSCLLGPSSFEISMCCSNALFLGTSAAFHEIEVRGSTLTVWF